MKILVTGGAGFIGSNLVSLIMARTDHNVVNLDAMTYAADHRLLDHLIGQPRYAFERTDIRDREAVRAVIHRHRPDWIMHLAAESHVDRSVEDPLTFVATNVMGTANLLAAAREHVETLSGSEKERFRFLHVSTDEVFGSLGAAGHFSETTAYDPSSPYSASKAASDHLVRAWATTFALPVIVTNCSNNYGPRQFPEKLIPLMTVNALEGELLPVYGTGANVRDWLHVEDHAEALLLAISRGTPGRTYCIGGNAEATNLAVVRRICDLVDARAGKRPLGRRRSLIRFVTDRPGHDRRYAIDAGLIRRELGWAPAHDFERGLAETVDWYLANEAWWRPLMKRREPIRQVS